ncbi:unnamed protein product [Orchesella dallaii]|uniref:EGF-like domain-containing protein n=1 Tax=Orchesella dallaii TaxID=48710 RepID=A0ABP1QJ38_9HEXA
MGHFIKIGLIGVLCIWGLAEAHVSMTYPPAREFSLDFLNTFWCKQPCGMPSGRYRTSLLAGSTFNATWHLGYAHQGGYRLELFDRQENKLLDLTPNEHNGFYRGRMTAQWHLVDLPQNLTCHDCTIRLLRQVPEFSPDFQFLSCSDVDIVDGHQYTETCSGHGYSSGGRCSCYSRYWGEKCQYEDECDTDADCNYRGKCIYLGGTALPRKQCFCSPTHFGTHCSKANPSSVPTSPHTLDLTKHVRVKLSDKMTMFFKVLIGSTAHQDQIEFLIQMNGTSFAGLGWRPSNLGPICKSWPFYPDALLPSAGSGSSHHSISKRSSTFTITKSVDHSETHPDDSSTLISSQRHNDERVFYRTEPQVSTSVHTSVPSRSKVVTASDIRHSQQGTYKPRRTKPRTTTTTPPPPPPPVHHSAGEQDQANFVPSEWAAKDAFTPMDCSDMVIGAARGSYHRIRDAYTRGRHSPKVDSEWGGRDDLTAAAGWERDGVTTLIFRRRLVSSDGPDHPINGEMLVIWARGQQPGEYVKDSTHHLEPNNPIISDFYTLDEYKYHGLGDQRGLLYIDFSAVRKEYASGAFS